MKDKVELYEDDVRRIVEFAEKNGEARLNPDLYSAIDRIKHMISEQQYRKG